MKLRANPQKDDYISTAYTNKSVLAFSCFQNYHIFKTDIDR